MSEDARARIKEAAARLFSGLGFAAVSMRDIAEAAGLSKPGLYHHFIGKEELLIAILEGELAAEAPLLARLGERERPWRARLEEWIEAVLNLPPERSSLVLRLGEELRHLDPERRIAFSRRYEEVFLGPLRNFLREGEGLSLVRTGWAEPGLWLLLGALSPFLRVNGRSGAPGHRESMASVLTTMLLEGLGAGCAPEVDCPGSDRISG